MTIKTPEQIAREIEREHYNDDAWVQDPDYDGAPIDALEDALHERVLTANEVRAMLREAVEADRAQFFDTSGSASSQHYIDTGRYMLHEEVAEMEGINAR